MRCPSGEHLVRLPYLDVEAEIADDRHALECMLRHVLAAADESLGAAKLLIRRRTPPARIPDADGVVLVDAGRCTHALTRAASLDAVGYHGVVVVVSPPVHEDVLLAGLDHGVHLWQEAPIIPRVLAGRIRSLVRRLVSDPPGSEVPVSVIPKELKVIVGGRAAKLTPRQFSVLTFLLERREHWHTAAEIVRESMDTNHRSDSSLVRVYVHQIRTALGDDAWMLESEERLGFRVVLRLDSTPARLKLPHPRYRTRQR